MLTENTNSDELVEAERHVEEARVRVAAQEMRVAELQRDGHDTERAVALARELKETLRLMEQHRELIQRELGISNDLWGWEKR